jgi:hypothetical protein
MGRTFKRLAAMLLLIAALTNGVFGPLAHGHALAGATTVPDSQIAASTHAEHAGCHEQDTDDPAQPGHPLGKHPGNSGLLCSGSTACCAAIAALDLPLVERGDRVEPAIPLRPVLVGLTPPVGERPPSRF